ncbi:prolyl tripeptidyl peptidase [Abditibacteriota bacterium]|nr:prolyl tripeptidyl peptidase [Abditibacteriota bacterium]
MHLLRLAVCATFAMSSSSAFAQGGRADYERAAVLPARLSNHVFRSSVAPHWSEDGNSFWYRVQSAPQKWEFVHVDPRTGTRKSAFDAKRLAEALGQKLGRTVNADNLPFSWIDVAPDGSWVHFRADKTVYEWKDNQLTPTTASLKEVSLQPIGRPHPSWRTGENTILTFDNRTGSDIQLIWVSTDGSRTPYAVVKPGTSYAQNTYGGHVWIVADAKDNSKVLGVYEANDDESIAVIGGPPANNDPKPKSEPKEPPAPKIEAPEPEKVVPAFEIFQRGFNLWRRDKKTRAETRLTTTGEAQNFYTDPETSPDGRFVVAMQTTPAQEHKVYMVDSSPNDQEQPKLKTIDYLKPGDRIEIRRPRLFDVVSGKEIATSDALFQNPWSIESLGWDGDNFRFLYNQRGHQNMRVMEFNAAQGTVRPLVEEHSDTFIDYSGKTYLKLLPDTNELLWASERDGWNHLYLFDTKTGKIKNKVTNGDFVMREVENVDEKTRQIWFRGFGMVPGQDPYYSQLARVNFDGTGLTVLTGGDGNHKWQWSPDKRFLLDTFSRVDMAPQTVLRDGVTSKQLCVLETSDLSELKNAGWTPTERFSAPGRDGQTPIYGVIVRPSNFDPNRKYPVIEQIYAGPQDFFTPKGFDTLTGFHQLADLGFIVVQLDGMGTNWRSKAFHDVCWKNLKDAGFPDRIAWMKAASATRPWMDISRVGVYGGSAGGQNALAALIWHGDFYKAAVADCGCHDNRMDKIWWNEQWMGWPVDKSYADSSNVEHAAQMQGKVQLVVGELDTNVDPASTMQVVNALIKADKDFELIVVPGANHGAGGGAYGTRRRNDFFVRSLLGVEPRS